jgi:hypothetical protein
MISTFCVRGSQSQVHLIGHRDRLVLAGVHHWQTEMDGGRQRRGNARDLGGQHLGRTDVGKAPRKLFAAGIHQKRVHLMIDKAIHFQNAPTQIFPIPQNPFF